MGKRETPLFTELRPILVTALRHAESNGRAGASDPVISRGDGSTIWRSALEEAIRRAGLKPWPKLFQNLRSPRETELMKQFPIAVVSAWLGNIQKIALAHYHQVTETDFAAVLVGKKATHSGADRRGPAQTGKDTNAGKPGKNEKAPAEPGLQMSLSSLRTAQNIQRQGTSAP